jgi:XTP/dITP diphosphohydrolase
MKICFATNNKKKIEEVKSALGEDFTIVSLEEIGCGEELPETGDTLNHNAFQKARYVKDHYGVDCFADDTGLEVDALNGEPGVYSARYAGEERDANANMDLLLEKLASNSSRSARFKTAMALILHGEEHVFEGIVEGLIIGEKRGSEGFGYDPIFEPEEKEKTFAEMSMEEKNTMSHRARALEKMIHFMIKDNFTHNL